MKTRIAMILSGLALLASCTQENENVPTSASDGVITLGVAGNGVMTRGVINTLEALSAEGTKVGIYGVKTAITDVTNSVTSDWTATTEPMANVQTTTIDKVTGAMDWLNPESYIYPKDDASDKNSVKFFAYYPYAPTGTEGDNFVTEASISTAPKLNFTLTGGMDLMWATPVLGSRTQPTSALKFNHKLTQLSFQLVDGEGIFSASNGSVTSVTISSKTKGVMNLETGEIANWGTPTDLNVYSGSMAVPTTPVPLNKTLMLQPEQASFTVTLKADGKGTEVEKIAEIKPTSDATFMAGKSYVITLSLSGNVLVQLGASVVPWADGGTGYGYIQ